MKRMIWTIFPLLAILSAPPLRGAMVVDDRYYLLAPGFRVHGSADGKLEKKMKIAFTTRNNDAGKKMITEVWVLPANFVLPEDD
jgi:hypothetical protein